MNQLMILHWGEVQQNITLRIGRRASNRLASGSGGSLTTSTAGNLKTGSTTLKTGRAGKLNSSGGGNLGS